ncbi:mechanosensitive ion channel family protein [Neisseria arctica]|uniref:mechanosensitive ion channel family protein n=1 Tax=Neisseria arctica TaxID=1470200 RepID=UPI00064ACC55|nr:mechanosensitive ion channel family protein [Neisseria arctica]UOO86770.1 mechanosensitive ion channel family protein [Neisseria arctica]
MITWEKTGRLLSDLLMHSELMQSLLLIVGVLLVRAVVVHTHFRRHPEMGIEDKRRWVVVSRNLTLILCIIGLIGVWAAQIQTLALSMLAVAAAIVLATKELIMCLLGSLLRAFTKQYSVGDYIEVGGLRGRVVDINLLNTLMMQIGPHPLVGQLSGKTVSFPNSLLLSQPVQRDNVLGAYVIHTFELPVPLNLDPEAVSQPITVSLQKMCAPFIENVERHLEQVQTQKLFITPAAHPRITYVPHDDKVYHLVVRFACPLHKRLEIQQNIIDEFMRVQHGLINSDHNRPL